MANTENKHSRIFDVILVVAIAGIGWAAFTRYGNKIAGGRGACESSLPAPESVRTPLHLVAETLRGKRTLSLSVTTKDGCYLPRVYPLTAYFNITGDFRIFFPSSATVDVTSVEMVGDKITAEQARMLDVDMQKGQEVLDSLHKLGPVQAVHYSVKNRRPIWHTRQLPQLIGHAIAVPPEQIDEAIKRNAVLVDIRSKAEFDSHHHPAAIHVPYEDRNPAFLGAEVPWETFGKTDIFDVKALPPVETPIVVIGSDQLDYRVVRALAFAWESGHKQIGFLTTGESGRIHEDISTPLSWPGIPTPDNHAVADALPQASVFVVTEPNTRFPLPIIKGARLMAFTPMPGRPSPFKLEPETLLKEGARLRTELLPADKAAPVIFAGLDKFDWLPLEAAILARHAGWTKVSWFRNGVLIWVQIGEAFPKKFPTQPAQ